MTFGGALSIVAGDHPNEMKFRGVLVRLDEPSTKAPNGASGHKILVPSDVARRRLKTLIGMGLNYASGLDKHDQRRKVGVIKKAWIDGRDLKVEAVIWKHDFPEAKKDLKQPGLGMSMEIGQVHVQDEKATVWNLQDFYFLGATILKKDAAAYYRTEAIAAKAERNIDMAKTNATVTLTSEQLTALGTIAAVAATKAIAPMRKTLTTLAEGMERLDGRLSAFEARANDDDEEEDDDVEATEDKAEEMDADDSEEEVVEDEETDEEDVEGTGADINKGDLEETGSTLDDSDSGNEHPGHMGDGAKNKGNKTTSQNKLGKTISKGVTGSAAFKKLVAQVTELGTRLTASEARNVVLLKKVKSYGTQAKKIAAETDRRSISAAEIDGMTRNMLAKSGIDADDMKAAGQKMTVEQVDAAIAATGLALDPVRRMEMKNRLYAAGLMEDGAVNRGR